MAGRRARQEPGRAEVLAVVAQAVHPDLAAVFSQRADEFVVDDVALRHQVPRGAQPELPLRAAQQLPLPEARGRLDVVGQHQRPRPSVRPQIEPGHRSTGQLPEQPEEPAIKLVQPVLDGPARETSSGPVRA